MPETHCSEIHPEIPRVEIPESAPWESWSGWTFKLGSGPEEIDVSVDRRVVCNGSVKALLSAGIVRAEWLPQAGKPSCIVMFGAAGVSIRTGGRGRPKGDYMHVCLRGVENLFVDFPSSPTQRASHAARREQDRKAQHQREACSPVTVAGIEHEEARDGTWKRWTGERYKLVQMEICREDQFPDGRKRIAYGDGWGIRRLSGERYEYTVRIAQENARPAPTRGAEYDSASAWREAVNGVVGMKAKIVRFELSGEWERVHFGATTFRFDEESMGRVNDALDDLLAAIEGGRIISTKSRPAESEAVKQARSDIDLQAFLAGIVSTTGDAA